MIDRPLYVTRPSLPPLKEVLEYLEGVWECGILTHNGPLVQQLEKDLIARLGVQNLIAMTNGTVAIQLAIRALNLTGEIITTPFTWIATVSAIQWEQCSPVFADVQADTFNLDPEQIEACITEKTSAILGVHVFSNPCNVEAIEALARKHGLKVIYDAAHAMCVNFGGKSLLSYGDISATSFHATKLFQTGEGGACVAADDSLAERLRRLRFFGHDENKQIVEAGLNGKMTEIHAALGLANLRRLDQVRANRRAKYELYRSLLEDCDDIQFQRFSPDSYNYSYMPILLPEEKALLKMIDKLQAGGVFPRRYFHPALNTIAAIAPYTLLPVAESLAQRILCLPLYDTLTPEEIAYVAGLLRG